MDYAGIGAPPTWRARVPSVNHALFRSLLADFLPAQMLRAGGLWALKLAPPLRKAAFDVGMGVR